MFGPLTCSTPPFSTPVTVLPGTTYVAGYFAPNGHYSATDAYFYNNPAPTPMGGANQSTAPLHAVVSTTSANDVYNYGSTSTFPTSTDDGNNYWVDVAFTLEEDAYAAARGNPGWCVVLRDVRPAG